MFPQLQSLILCDVYACESYVYRSPGQFEVAGGLCRNQLCISDTAAPRCCAGSHTRLRSAGPTLATSPSRNGSFERVRYTCTLVCEGERQSVILGFWLVAHLWVYLDSFCWLLVLGVCSTHSDTRVARPSGRRRAARVGRCRGERSDCSGPPPCCVCTHTSREPERETASGEMMDRNKRRGGKK